MLKNTNAVEIIMLDIYSLSLVALFTWIHFATAKTLNLENDLKIISYFILWGIRGTTV